jgi:hypothetical protein
MPVDCGSLAKLRLAIPVLIPAERRHLFNRLWDCSHDQAKSPIRIPLEDCEENFLISHGKDTPPFAHPLRGTTLVRPIRLLALSMLIRGTTCKTW